MGRRISRLAIIAIAAPRPGLRLAAAAILLTGALTVTAGPARAGISHGTNTKPLGSSAKGGSLPHKKSPIAAVPPKGYGKGTGYCSSYSGGVTSSYSFKNVDRKSVV